VRSCPERSWLGIALALQAGGVAGGTMVYSDILTLSLVLLGASYIFLVIKKQWHSRTCFRIFPFWTLSRQGFLRFPVATITMGILLVAFQKFVPWESLHTTFMKEIRDTGYAESLLVEISKKCFLKENETCKDFRRARQYFRVVFAEEKVLDPMDYKFLSDTFRKVEHNESSRYSQRQVAQARSFLNHSSDGIAEEQIIGRVLTKRNDFGPRNRDSWALVKAQFSHSGWEHLGQNLIILILFGIFY